MRVGNTRRWRRGQIERARDPDQRFDTGSAIVPLEACLYMETRFGRGYHVRCPIFHGIRRAARKTPDHARFRRKLRNSGAFPRTIQLREHSLVDDLRPGVSVCVRAPSS